MPKRLLVLRADEGLAIRAAAGDDAAFEVLYERYVSGILSFCRHMLGSVEEAEDAAQHAFAALHAELARGPEGLHLRAWLYTVARNRCLSTLRGRRERTDETLVPHTAGLTGEIERRADLRELLADLHDLPTDQRAALVLSELGDLSQVEVAEVLGTEAAKVKGLVFRARSGLIERRDARAASCLEIRGELATARRGALRRGRLRHHLRACPECAAYLEDVRRQRRMMALLLPVMPSVGLKRGVFAAAGLGTGAGAGAGGLAVSKLVVIGAVAGSAAVGGGAAAELSSRDPGTPPATTQRERAPTSGTDARSGSASDRRGSDRAGGFTGEAAGRSPGRRAGAQGSARERRDVAPRRDAGAGRALGRGDASPGVGRRRRVVRGRGPARERTRVPGTPAGPKRPDRGAEGGPEGARPTPPRTYDRDPASGGGAGRAPASSGGGAAEGSRGGGAGNAPAGRRARQPPDGPAG